MGRITALTVTIRNAHVNNQQDAKGYYGYNCQVSTPPVLTTYHFFARPPIDRGIYGPPTGSLIYTLITAQTLTLISECFVFVSRSQPFPAAVSVRVLHSVYTIILCYQEYIII